MSDKKIKKEGMTVIARTITNVLVSVQVLFGVYITSYGHLSPGGGFAGGVIIAAAFILLTLSHGGRFSLKKFPDLVASLLDNIGALGFTAIGLLGYLGGVFFVNFLDKPEPFGLLSSGTIYLSNLAIMLKVMAGLFAIFIGLAIFGRIVAEGDKEDE